MMDEIFSVLTTQMCRKSYYVKRTTQKFLSVKISAVIIFK